jgi:hypothetical protein
MALLAAAAAVALAFFIARPGAVNLFRALPDNPWWFIYREAPRATSLEVLWRIGAALATAAIAAAAAFRSFVLFNNVSSPILPFLTVFFFSLGLECLRAGTACLYAADGSIEAAIVLTRVMYWGRFVGLLGLLCGGLFCIELRYRKYGVLTAVVFLVSFAMAAYIPIDRTVFLAQLTWKLGDEQGVWFVNLVIGALTVATSAGASLARRDRRFIWLAAGFILLLVSRELLFFAVEPVHLGCGLLSLSGGVVLCLRTLLALQQPGKEPGAST